MHIHTHTNLNDFKHRDWLLHTHIHTLVYRHAYTHNTKHKMANQHCNHKQILVCCFRHTQALIHTPHTPNNTVHLYLHSLHSVHTEFKCNHRKQSTHLSPQNNTLCHRSSYRNHVSSVFSVWLKAHAVLEMFKDPVIKSNYTMTPENTYFWLSALVSWYCSKATRFLRWTKTVLYQGRLYLNLCIAPSYKKNNTNISKWL